MGAMYPRREAELQVVVTIPSLEVEIEAKEEDLLLPRSHSAVTRELGINGVRMPPLRGGSIILLLLLLQPLPELHLHPLRALLSLVAGTILGLIWRQEIIPLLHLLLDHLELRLEIAMDSTPDRYWGSSYGCSRFSRSFSVSLSDS
uniref:Uncharacterized protein n=1 Tax=Oryza meridionalis TaxID=40149 RepID=A0A0E0DL94_9ORYZ